LVYKGLWRSKESMIQQEATGLVTETKFKNLDDRVEGEPSES